MLADNLNNILNELPSGVKLVAVSKYYPAESIIEAYGAGQRVFGESRPQEFCKKLSEVPFKDIEWHFIGHLQTNKLKMVLPYVAMVESVDSLHLLQEIDKWGRTAGRPVDILLEMHIGAEETKQGLHEEDVLDILFNAEKYPGVRFRGLMGMASNTDDESVIEADFRRIDAYMAYLVDLFPELTDFNQLSIGMSGDWRIAIRNGATIVRIGRAIFA